MKLAMFTHAGGTRLGVVQGDMIADLATADPALPPELKRLLELGPAAMERAREAAKKARDLLPLSNVRLEAPIDRPNKFIAVGLNYADHVAETGSDRPEFPTIFNKQNTCVNRTGGPVHLPRVSPDMLDYEGEMAFVIGRRCRHVPRARAAEVIAGYCIVNDVSVRDWQLRTPTMTIGKSFDTHGPIGPWLTTADEVGDPHVLSLRTTVNGEQRQASNTSHLIFNCFQLVEHLSTAFTLEPGDVISTGTPSGVGLAMKPRCMLKAGDVVRIEIEKLGAIENQIIDEPGDTVSLGALNG